jgi:hypothetical protein
MNKSFLLLGAIFFGVDPTFSVFDETVKEVPNKMYRRVESASNGSHRHTINCLTDFIRSCEN